MDDYRVPTVPLTVELHCADGRRFAGRIFLPAQSSRIAGAMLPEEWVDTPQPFFPFSAEDGGHPTIFNKRDVVALTVKAEANLPPDDEEAADLALHGVIVEACGQRFGGDVLIDMPRNQRRIVDVLNNASTFVTVRDGDRHHLIQKRHITRVIEMGRRNAERPWEARLAARE
jgi:hypothetical protein